MSDSQKFFPALVNVSIFIYILLLIGGFFSKNIDPSSGNLIFLDQRRAIIDQTVLYLQGLLCLALLAMYPNELMRLKKVSVRVPFFVLAAGYVFLNILVNQEIKIIFLFSLIFLFLFLFRGLSTHMHDGVKKTSMLFWALTIIVALPTWVWLVYFLITGQVYFHFTVYQLYFYRSLSGIALDYTQLSFAGSILFLYHLLIRKSNFFVLAFVSLPVILSVSAAGYIALGLSLAYWYCRGVFYMIFLLGSFTMLCLAGFLGLELLSYFGVRGVIYSDSFHDIVVNDRIWFGSGQFFTHTSTGHQPHSWLVQTLLDFGIVGVLLFLVVIFQAFLVMRRQARVFFIFMLLFFAAHAGFSAFALHPMSMFLFSVIILSNHLLERPGLPRQIVGVALPFPGAHQ